MTGKLMFVPDTHVVVPKSFLARAESAYATTDHVVREIRLDEAFAILKAAPPLTTPPVLRWENGSLKIYDFEFANVSLDPRGWAYTFTGVNGVWFKNSEQEARRAAEKALGLPIVEEV